MQITNEIISGDAIGLASQIPDTTLDAVITDPPYGVRYKDRSGRQVRNDDDISAILPVFGELYRALKPGTFCISFYGWNKADSFMQAWRNAGFRIAGHLVWTKDYASNQGYVRYSHEQAYILTKGRPERPVHPISDVQSWIYSGNRSHPTEKSVEILKPLVEAFSQPGDLICDPFSGSGSTAVAAALLGRSYLGFEIEEKYCQLAEKRLAGVNRYKEAAA